ncbi:hypothetical protein BH20ACT18_BH20ACT18_06340 [soil metagenome]
MVLKRVRLSFQGQGKWALLSAVILGALVSPFAIAADGDTMKVGAGNSADTKETNISGQKVKTFATRQSNNLEGDGGSATYGCRSSAANEPCLEVFALRTARAFFFRSRGPELGRLSYEGTANPATIKPFTTNATGVATGLNADKVDGKDATDLVGATGPAGPAGPAGPRGPSDAFSSQSGTNIQAFVANTDQTVATVALPAGKFVLTGKVVANNNEAVARQVDCSLNLGPTQLDNLFGDAGLDIQGSTTDDRVVISLTGAGTLAAAGNATVVCRTNGGSGNWIARSITAIQVATVNGS